MNDSDLQALDDIWPIGRQLTISDGGTVIIAGAYRGRYMHYVAEAYPKTGLIVGFEPQRQEAKIALHRTHKYENCKVVSKALGTETVEQVPMGGYGTDGCSLIMFRTPIELVSVVEFSEAMKVAGVKAIDCFICNMEGYEYHLLPHILKKKWHEKIRSMAVQFHPEVALGEQTIRAALNDYYGEPIQSPGWYYWRKQ